MRKLRNNKNIFFMFLLLLCAQFSQAQREHPVTIIIAPDHPDWIYKVNETVTFNIQIYKYGNLVKDAVINYDLGPEMYPTEQKKDVRLKDGTLKLKAKMDRPGFLRCNVSTTIDGIKYSDSAEAGIEPEKIQPTTVEPEDFDEFWNNAISEARKTPLSPSVTLLPERCTDKVNVYHVSFQNIRPGSRTFGILCVPKKPGKYPALLRVPGAGIRPYAGDAWTAGYGAITLEIGIHGVPVNMPTSYYDNLYQGGLYQYWLMNRNNRDEFYFKRVFIGCVRAVDFICSLPEFDGKTLGVTGSSQGGALSFVTAALDKRVTFLAPVLPAMCDHTASLENRADGWPHFFHKKKPQPGEVETSRYYDVVNFARRITVKGWYGLSYNDATCPPTTTFGAYNCVKAPKELYRMFDTGHWWYDENYTEWSRWLRKQLGVE